MQPAHTLKLVVGIIILGLATTAHAQLPTTNVNGIDFTANNSQTNAATGHLRLRYNSITLQPEASVSGSGYVQVLIGNTGPGSGTYGGSNMAVSTLGLDAQGRVTAVTTANTAGLFNILDYGATTGATDNTTAIQNAINAAAANHGNNARGGVVYVPPGQFKFASQINMKGLFGVTIAGAGGPAPGSPKSASTLLYTGTGATSAIAADAGIGLTFQDIGILYLSASFTGYLIDFGQNAQGSGGAYDLVTNCLLGGDINDTLNAFQAAGLVRFDNTIDSAVLNSIVGNGVVGIWLRDSNTHFSNSILISNNVFHDFSTGAITNGSVRNQIIANTFENNPNMIAYNVGHPGTYPTMAPAFTYTTSMAQYGLEFSGNYIGDGDGSTYCFDTVNSQQYGSLIDGNFILGKMHFATFFGGSLSSNTIQNVQLDFDASVSTYSGLTIANNGIPGTFTFTNFPAVGVSTVGNRATSSANNVADNLFANKLSSESGNLVIAPFTGIIAPPTDSSGQLGTSSLRYQTAFIKILSAAASGLTLTGANVSYVLNASGFDIGSAATFQICQINATLCSISKSTVNTVVNGNLAGAKGLAGGFRSAGTPVTVAVTDHYVGVTGTGARSVTLPAASTCIQAGQEFIVQDVAGSTGVITISRSGSDTINGTTSLAMGATAYARQVLYCDGVSAWYAASTTL